MLDISIMIEGQMGITWPRWKQLVATVEELGFAGLFRSDHFTGPEPPDQASLETIISLAYVADHTQRIHFGPLVAPVSFREPVMLARQAAAIDDLSGGRMMLGLGAGWQDREHTLFGYELGDTDTRFARLTEALEVMTRLLQSNEPSTFEGQFFQIRDATLLPRPQRPGGPQILIGGNGPKRTLPLVTRFATVWNGVGLTPDAFRERSAMLDDMLRAHGRQPGEVRRTMMTGQIVAPDRVALEQKLRENARPEQRGMSFDELLKEAQSGGWRRLIGTPDMIAEQLAAYADAGVKELMLQWFDFDDMDALRAFADIILPLAAQ